MAIASSNNAGATDEKEKEDPDNLHLSTFAILEETPSTKESPLPTPQIPTLQLPSKDYDGPTKKNQNLDRWELCNQLPAEGLEELIGNNHKHKDKVIRGLIGLEDKISSERRQEAKVFKEEQEYREKLQEKIKKRNGILKERDLLIQRESIQDVKIYIEEHERLKSEYEEKIQELKASDPLPSRKLEQANDELGLVNKKLFLLKAWPAKLKIKIAAAEDRLLEIEQQQQPAFSLDDPMKSPRSKVDKYHRLRMETTHTLPFQRLFTQEQAKNALGTFGFTPELLSKISKRDFEMFCASHVSLPSYKQPQARNISAQYIEEIKRIRECYASRRTEDISQMATFAGYLAQKSPLDLMPIYTKATEIIQFNNLIEDGASLDKIEGDGHEIFMKHVGLHFQFEEEKEIFAKCYQLMPKDPVLLFQSLCFAIENGLVDYADTDDRTVSPIARTMEKLFGGKSDDLLPEYQDIYLRFLGRAFNNILYDTMLSNFMSASGDGQQLDTSKW